MRIEPDIPRRAVAGFTAIELLVVLVVVLILIGMAVPALLGAMHKGSVNDAANAIVRVSSQARQYARMRAIDAANKYYGLIIVAPDNGKPVYVALTYGATCPPVVGDIIESAAGKPVSKLNMNRNVVVYTGPANDPELTNASTRPLEPNNSVGWLYQYRTGYPIYPSGASSGWTTAASVNIGVDPTIAPAGTIIVPAAFPSVLRHLTLRTVDRRYRTAVAIYQIGLPNVQDF